VFFTTMIDLYAIPTDFPGLNDAQRLRNNLYQRVEQLEKAWAQDIADFRFLPFIQLHEFEAYLFTEPGEFGLFYPEAQRQIANLRAIAEAHGSPELIDDGPNTAPSKRIINELSDYEGAKAAIGPQVGEMIGLQAIRGKCPHFHRWLTSLEELGKQGTS